jgi:hypothetical protein
MAFLTPLALLGALLAIPVILLYMLRLRRRELVVSSTLLWQQILRDSEANTPWQRLRRNLLLFLQLLILALIVLALARPFINVPAVTAGQIELLLDASASMNATDMPDGGTRFDEAKRQALSIVDTMGATDIMTIIRVANVAEVIAPATADRLALRTAIQNTQPSKTEADWVAALTLAAADAANALDFNLVVISDGGLGEASGLPGVPGQVRYIPVGQSDSNLAITALATSALPGQAPQLFAQVTNYGQEEAEVIFDLRVDGQLFSAERYSLPANESLPIVTGNLPADFSMLQAGLTLPVESAVSDFLPDDNTAWTIPSGSGTRRALLMTEGNLFLEQILRSVPSIQAFKGDLTRPLPNDPYDLYIFDSWLPADNQLPAGDLLIINPPRSTSLFTVGSETDQTANITTNANDSRMTFVDFGAVSVLRFRQFAGVDWAQPLITADGGPLVLAGERDGRQIALFTFDIHDSDLPLQITWPILMSNLLEWFTPQSIINAPGGLRVGESLSIRPPFEATGVRIVLPDGIIRDLATDRQTVVFADTETPGVYQVDNLKGSEVIQSGSFVVNLFAPGESNIAPRGSISLSGNDIAPSAREEVGQQEFWPWVALAALIVLLIEWYVYQRRIQTPTVFAPVRQRAMRNGAMNKRYGRRWIVIVVAGVVIYDLLLSAMVASGQVVSDLSPPFPSRVLLISLDGARPDGILKAETPHIQALAARGAVSWQARTIFPPVTLPSHTSMLTGLTPDQHRVNWNATLFGCPPIEPLTVLTLAEQAGYTTAMVAGKEKFCYFAQSEGLNYSFAQQGDRSVADRAIELLDEGYQVIFAHFPNPDFFGHSAGWMSDIYLFELSNTDLHVGRVLLHLDDLGLTDETLIILSADHGGHEFSHGRDIPEDMLIPWIIAGPGITAGLELYREVITTDTAATILWALGIPLPDNIAGQPVYEAFVSPA